MSLEVRVEEWLREMGYHGEIPPSLPKICNPTSAFIWEQLISNVKPRQTIKAIKHNILVNRLSQKPMEKQDEFGYPIKEIETYMEKLKLEKKVRGLEKVIEEKEAEIDEMLNRNKVIYTTIDNIKARIKEKKERKFLLAKKSQLIEADIQHAQDVLSLARNLTPVEMEASANAEEITKTLQQCAEKLQKLSDTVSLPKTNTSRSLISSTITPKTSKHSKKNTLFQYVNQSTVLTDIAPSCRKHNYMNKENINYRAICRPLKFSDSLTEEENKPDKFRKKNNRESLGLLAPDCLNTTDELDVFLLDSPEHENWTLHPMTDSLHETKDTGDELLKKLRGQEKVKEVLTDLLHQNNRYLIVTQCKNIYEELFTELNVTFMECSNLTGANSTIGQSDITELYFIHVEEELEKEKNRLAKKKLSDTIKIKKKEILSQLCDVTRNKEDARRLESQIEQAYVTGANIFLRSEINSSQKPETGNEIELLNLKIKQNKDEIASKSSDVQFLASIIFKVFQEIRKNREETSSCVQSLLPCSHNLNWATDMTKNITSQELEVFKNFPLEYNRKFMNKNSQIYYRDISDTKIPSYLKMDANDVAMITSLMDAPFSSAENVIFDVLQTKTRAKMLQAMQPRLDFSDTPFNKYLLEDFRRREDCLEPVINKLDCFVNSKSVKEVLSAVVVQEEVARLWQEMSFRSYISGKRQVDGHNYSFYEQKLEKLRDN